MRINFKNKYKEYKFCSMYQYDINQVLEIEGIALYYAPQIHFSNSEMTDAYVVNSEYDNGIITCNIPDIMFAYSCPIEFYIYDDKTYYKGIIDIIPRQKPADYIVPPTPCTDLVSREELENNINDIKLLLNEKVDKETGKVLSTNDFTDELKATLEEIATSFITKTVNDLTNYYLKSETYTKAEVNNKISEIPKFSIEVVTNLPIVDISATTVYLLITGDEPQNLYTEYIYVNDMWEKLGTQTVDLTGYATESWVNTQIADFLTDAQIKSLINTALNDYYTKEQANSLLLSKLNKEDYTIYGELNEEAFINEINFSVDFVQKNYEVYYYADLQTAINDIHTDAIGTNTSNDKTIMVYNAPYKSRIIPIITILKDYIETNDITVALDDLLINLNSKVITFTSTNTTAILHTSGNLTIADFSKDKLGEIKFTGVAASTNGVQSTSTGNMDLINCKFSMTGTRSTLHRMFFLKNSSITTVKNCSFELDTSGGTARVFNVGNSSNTPNVYIDDCVFDCVHTNGTDLQTIINYGTIYATNIKINSYIENVSNANMGILNYNSIHINGEETNIYCDAPNSDTAGSYSVAIHNQAENKPNAVVEINDGVFFGTHSGMTTIVKTLRVNGGRFTSVAHGGIYFNYNNGSSFVKNAEIGCVEYNGRFDISQMNAQYLGCFYIGGDRSAINHDINVYIDNCVLLTATNRQDEYAFVLRNTDNEQNNCLYISNTAIPIGHSVRIDGNNYVYAGQNMTINSSVSENITVTNEVYSYENRYIWSKLNSSDVSFNIEGYTEATITTPNLVITFQTYNSNNALINQQITVNDAQDLVGLNLYLYKDTSNQWTVSGTLPTTYNRLPIKIGQVILDNHNPVGLTFAKSEDIYYLDYLLELAQTKLDSDLLVDLTQSAYDNLPSINPDAHYFIEEE